MTNEAKNVYRCIKEYYQKFRVFPRFEHITLHTGFEKATIIDLLRELEEFGYVVRNYSQYKVNIDVLEKKQIEDEKRKEEDLLKKDPIKRIYKTFIDTTKLFKIMNLFIGLLSLILSIYFTYIWFIEFLNPFISGFLAVSMVGFSIISFEMLILFFQSKNYMGFIAFLLLWIIVVIFSITSTIAGQYNHFLKIEKKEVKIDQNGLKIYESLELQINQVNEELSSRKQEREKLKEFMNSITDFEDKNYKNINYQISVKNKLISNLSEKLTNLQNEKTELLKNNDKMFIEKQFNFFEWISSVLKVKKSTVQFWLNLFPAVFVDISAPICLAVAIFLKKED